MKNLIVATSNPGKLKEMGAYLTGLDWQLQLKPEEIEIEETGATFAQNAALKASQVAKILGQWSIADDSGLCVTALDNAPGIYSARYGKNDSERIARLLRELGDNSQRQARFICAVAVANPSGEIVCESTGICEGEIIFTPQGDSGFGYDPIFYVPEYNLTFAQMPPDLKRQVSHRGKAFAAIIPKLIH
ncbi:MAG: RdgB/HAM1 family non-canonical purine NTP pyrophosphatase [Chlorogloea purpurea SAG 13.99]|nr:RdgB/HAM1 family non-canonical purine NTP pyrophosphatase [Chlorogloea purpurea SAG 13.99]